MNRTTPETGHRTLRRLLSGAALLLAGLVLSLNALLAQDPVGREVVQLTVADAIGPATRDYIVRGIEEAEDTNAELVVLKLDTPGGLDASMRDIISKILNAEVPVATWIAPDGARAASAGTYILLASPVAAMAPATHLGAATPVPIGGAAPTAPAPAAEPEAEPATDEPMSEDTAASGDEAAEAEPPAAPADASSSKAINDAVAYIRGLAERHGRNADWAERAVREAVTLTAPEALEQNVIDLIAENIDDLLAAIDGREVKLHDRSVTLATEGLAVREIEPDWRTSLLAIITNPTLAYILLLVGVYGLLLEGYNPGALVPGIIGGISLLLALYAFQILPVNYAGLALMALGLALIAAELFVPSFGILGIGGLVAVVFGSVILFDEDVPGFAVNEGVIAGLAVSGAVLFGMIVWMIQRALQRPRMGGRASLIDHTAEAIADFTDGRGRVHLQGEDWFAHAEADIRRGQRVRITGIQDEGFVLDVVPLNDDER
ncbi:nodulation protein NfeD [Wenzhouxiangella sp. XN79A]|uniref:NfeD family protein n=1 Tax=Wenzhouxiangella sp. XN79A TaxID=2724193 RepID=UPI00144AA3FF|nr:nodulation protein NfeD [Wenzhouxiangella sp. XN79A]NKI35344.1 nodulation protein NfeD [Wenzhouxiangella sp. XN79A]